MSLSAIAIDDEPDALEIIRILAEKVPFLHLQETFTNAFTGIEYLQKNEIDLLFLDIKMPDITGIELLKSLPSTPMVIFTTAYSQYALDGFEVNALDYLVKPVSFERFLKAAMKAQDYYEVRENNITETASASDYFFIKADNKLVKLFFEDVLFAEALQNYVVIHTKDKKYITYLTFKSVEEYLPVDRFIKTHKSFIIAAEKTESIEGNNIRIGSHDIPISRNLKDEVMEKLLKGKFLKR